MPLFSMVSGYVLRGRALSSNSPAEIGMGEPDRRGSATQALTIQNSRDVEMEAIPVPAGRQGGDESRFKALGILSNRGKGIKLSQVHYTLAGGSVFSNRGKEKVSEMAMRFRGCLPAFASPCQPECSDRGSPLVVAKLLLVTLLHPSVTVEPPISTPLSNVAEREKEMDRIDEERELAYANKRLSEHLIDFL